MKYSDSVKAILLAAIDELAADPEKYAKNPASSLATAPPWTSSATQMILALFLGRLKNLPKAITKHT